MPTNNPNVGVAFALVSGAGMCTALGAAIVFSPTLVKYASRKTLAAALGLSAGVMSYVSFVEILQKSTLSFQDAGHSDDEAYLYSTSCFFGGVVLMIVSTHLFLGLQTLHGSTVLLSTTQ
jgi:ZIP family zinc transporter